MAEEMRGSDAGMFAALTTDEINVLSAHLSSGMAKQHYLTRDNLIHHDTYMVLGDLHAAWDMEFHQGGRP